MQNTNKPAHHEELPPSSAAMIFFCNMSSPGSEDNPFSGPGTELHSVAQDLVENKYKKNNPKYVAPFNKDVLKVSEYEATIECVDDAMNFIKATIHNVKPEQIKTEITVSINDNHGKEISFGSADLFATDGKIFIGLDWKSSFGFNQKNAYHEPQMAFYALGLMQKHNIDEIIWVEAHLLPGKLVTYNLTRDRCEAMVTAVWLQKYKNKKKYVPNHYCKYCGRIANIYNPCPKIMKYADAFGCHVPADILASFNNVKNIEDGKEMSDLLISVKDQVEQYQKKLENVVKTVKEAALNLSNNGTSIPYFERKSTVRKSVNKISRAWELISGISKEKFEEHCNLSVNKLGENVANSLGLTQKDSKENLWGNLLPIINMSTTYSLKRKKKK